MNVSGGINSAGGMSNRIPSLEENAKFQKLFRLYRYLYDEFDSPNASGMKLLMEMIRALTEPFGFTFVRIGNLSTVTSEEYSELIATLKQYRDEYPNVVAVVLDFAKDKQPKA